MVLRVLFGHVGPVRHPDRYPDYVSTHYKQLNTLARKRGQGEIVGIGPKGIEGEKAAEDRVREGKRPMSDWTYMAKENPLSHHASYPSLFNICIG